MMINLRRSCMRMLPQFSITTFSSVRSIPWLGHRIRLIEPTTLSVNSEEFGKDGNGDGSKSVKEVLVVPIKV